MAISLNDLKRGRDNRPPRIIIHGVPGIGKTSFAAGAESPVFLPTEEGFGSLDVVRFPLLQTWAEVVETLTALCEEEHEHKTLVLDTVDKLEKIIWADVCREKGKPNIEEIGFGKGYVAALTYWQQLLQALDYLREQKHMTIILIAHTLIKTFSPPDQDLEAYDVYRLDLHDKAAGVLKDWADVILFARYKMWTKKSNDQKAKAAKGIGEGERILLTEERPSHWAKNRYGLPYELPFPREGAYQVFQAALNQSLNSNNGKN